MRQIINILREAETPRDLWRQEGYAKHTELVAVERLLQFRGNDLRDTTKVQNLTTGEYERVPFAALVQSIRERGIDEPLLLIVGKKDRRACLGEGNHRLMAAQAAGLDYVPVRCNVQSSGSHCERGGIDVSDNLKVPANEWFPADTKPSDVFIHVPVEAAR
jgi:hypothetical protein